MRAPHQCYVVANSVQLYLNCHDMIKQPIALSTIRNRITSGYYKSVVDFWDDLWLICNDVSM